ncbi:Quinol monooxygenase YgiN [Geodermatophilus amargosae]|uniref:Quinol monooxygenase YgiN n=1 Tax=Geodermatophilus amargosae TaxID=1296565 RepID=A0A1I7D7F8_9ACTN|nr:putative quinol monooxygenase [Geodermatophilus amargosae]SFU07626.1 Quinol monooxygenase YgiN [Geodermatophilus amargosae]
MLIVLGSATAAPGRRHELVDAARAVTAATRSDDGCLSYVFAADLDDPDVVVSVEVWRDQAALDAHMTHDHTQRFIAAVGGLQAGEPSMSFHTVPDPA